MARTNDQKRLYKDLAWLWPIFSTADEYAPSTRDFVRLIKESSKIKTRTVLHLGCGGGLNDLTLKKHFRVTGVDLNRKMLAQAKKLNPGVRYVQGDMRSVRLQEKFDAVIIPDSLDYMTSEKDLKRALKTAAYHLNPGGVLLIAIENTAETFKNNACVVYSRKRPKIWLNIIENIFDPDPKDTSYEVTFIYLIREKGKLTIETDRHLLGLFRSKKWLKLIKAAGFTVQARRYSPPPPEHGVFPIFICRKV